MLRAAAAAGLLAALGLTLVQARWVTPLILEAETYESSVLASNAHEHNETATQVESIWSRTAGTALANATMGLGYGLILGGLYLLRRPSGLMQGAAWGLAGYTVFFAAPSLGLPPDLPGTETADLSMRQHWWLGTVLATGTGLGLLFLQARRSLRALGLTLLILPHWLGAPHPAIAAGLAPEALQTHYRVATFVCNALFWLLLGTLAYAFQRGTREEHW
jgi:cobalt transporter subunit CbtA